MEKYTTCTSKIYMLYVHECVYMHIWTSPVVQMAKNLLAMQGIPGSGRILWRREWLPTPVFLPRESHGQRSLVDYGPWDRKELDTSERLSIA